MASLLIKLLIALITLTQITSITTCPSNQFYFKDKCYTACTLQAYETANNGDNPDGITALYIKTQGSQACVSDCSAECSTCFTYADFCTSCKQPLNGTAYLLESAGKCFVGNCPVYYFQNTTLKTCISCSTLSLNCKNCTTNYQCTENGGTLQCNSLNSVLCMSCDLNFYSLIDGSNMLQCISSVPDGYVSLNWNLTKCTSDCLTCKDYPSNCLSCKTLNYLNSQCLPQCPLSHYSTQTLTQFNSQQIQTLICTRCLPNCNTCTNQTFCLSCLLGFYLVQDQGMCVTSAACPEKTYPNTTTYMCDACKYPCVRCFNGNQCKECAAGLSLFGKACVGQCPNVMYSTTVADALSQNSQKVVCTSCISPCEKCINETACISCLQSTGLIFYQDQNSCLSECPKGFKPNSMNITCEKCPSNCSACNQVKCTQCSAIDGVQYVLYEGKCINSCPVSYFVSQELLNTTNNNTTTTISVCKLCPSSCGICQNQTYCSKCRESYFFYAVNNSCLQACPSEAPIQTPLPSTSLPTLYQCKPCSDLLCMQCTKLDYCYKCVNQSSLNQNEATILSNGTCEKDCPQNYTKTYDNSTSLWTCQFVPPKENKTQTVPQQQIVKGIIVPVFYPFIATEVSAGIFVILAIVFLTRKICSSKRGLFFPFVTGFLAIPQTIVIGGCLFYHLMYNYYDYFQRFRFMPETYVLFISVFLYLVLSLVNMIIFLRIFCNDVSFHQWSSHNSICSKFLLCLILSLSLLNFTLQNLFWSKFSTFPVLSSVDKLKPFTVISGLSLASICGMVVAFVLLSFKQGQIKQIYYDGIAVLAFCSLVNLFSLKRPEDLFIFEGEDKLREDNMLGEESDFKINLHKRSFATDHFFYKSMKPETYEEGGVLKKKPKYVSLISSEDMLISSRNSQKSLNRSQDEAISSRLTEEQRSSIIMQWNAEKKDQNQSVIIFDDPDQLNEKSISIEKRKSRQIQRLHHSLTGIYEQSRSQIQTEETSEQDVLNQGISEIDEGSEKVQMGSQNDEVQDFDIISQQENKNQKLSKQDKRKKQKDIIIQKLKLTKIPFSTKIASNHHQKNQQFKNKLELNQEFKDGGQLNHASEMPFKHSNEQELLEKSLQVVNKNSQISENSQHLIKFLDISELQDIKESGLKIDNSQKALFQDSVIISHQSQQQISRQNEQQSQKVLDLIDQDDQDVKSVSENRFQESKKQDQIDSKQNNSEFSQDLESSEDLQQPLEQDDKSKKDDELITQQEIVSIQNNSSFSESYQSESYHEKSAINNSKVNISKVKIEKEQNLSKVMKISNVSSKKDQIQPFVIEIRTKEQQIKQEINPKTNQNPTKHAQLNQEQKQIEMMREFSLENQQKESIESGIQLIDIVNSSKITIKSPEKLNDSLQSSRKSFTIKKDLFVEDEKPQKQEENIDFSKEQFSNHQDDQFMFLEEEKPNERPLRQTNQQIQSSQSISSEDLSQQNSPRLPPVEKDPIQHLQENYFRIQTKIKKNPSKNIRLIFNSQKAPKEEILVVDDKKFRNLKRKLKSIEKQEQKQVKILRRIEEGRFVLKEENPRQNHQLQPMPRSKSRDHIQRKTSESKKSKNRVIKNIEQSKTLMNQSEKPPKRVSKKKSELELQSKLHVQKIYRNSLTIKDRSNSYQRRSSLQRGNKQENKSIDKRHNHQN